MKVTTSIIRSIELEKSEIKLLKMEYDNLKDTLKSTLRKRHNHETEDQTFYETIFELLDKVTE